MKPTFVAILAFAAAAKAEMVNANCQQIANYLDQDAAKQNFKMVNKKEEKSGIVTKTVLPQSGTITTYTFSGISPTSKTCNVSAHFTPLPSQHLTPQQIEVFDHLLIDRLRLNVAKEPPH